MLFRISDFCNTVKSNIDGLVEELAEETGRYNDKELSSWKISLSKVGEVLNRKELKDYHLFIPNDGSLFLEYRLPSSSSWCDIVLLGKNNNTPTALIIELKDWDTRGDKPGPVDTLIERKGSYYLHPSDQVRGYVNYCRRFHSYIQDSNATVKGCVYFSQVNDLTPYTSYPHSQLTSDYPVYSCEKSDKEFVKYITDCINTPDETFAQNFIKGKYKQDRNLVLQVSQNFQQGESPFELLDEQRKGFELVVDTLNKSSNSKANKQVIIVIGPPGSGKSALAANLWAHAAQKYEGNIVFTTTSSSQRENWESLFKLVGKNKAANGIVVAANRYNPGLSPQWQSRKKTQGHNVEVENWKNNLTLYLKENENKSPDNLHFVSIVDEAHALIDPSRTETRGISPSGWAIHAGPQGWHIIRSSKVTVFLLDSEQSYRDNETTTIEYIKDYAKDLRANVTLIDLSDMQFRCGGSTEYIEWSDNLLGLRSAKPNLLWRKHQANPAGKFIFELVESPFELDTILGDHYKKKNSVRLLSSYSKEWKTSEAPNPHKLHPSQMDFYFEINSNNVKRIWNRIWNYAPKQDYTLFVQAPKFSKMYENPLCEVGCPYVVRGFDYDYIGILWLDDLLWRKDRWVTSLDQVPETAWTKTKAQVKRDNNYDPLLKKIKKSYRILLSRGIKGVYIWVKDEETRAYIASHL